MPDAPQYTGHLKRGDTPDTVVGSIRDAWGWTIHLTGTRDPAGGGYVLTGTLGEVPAALRVEGLDAPATGRAP